MDNKKLYFEEIEHEILEAVRKRLDGMGGFIVPDGFYFLGRKEFIQQNGDPLTSYKPFVLAVEEETGLTHFFSLPELLPNIKW